MFRNYIKVAIRNLLKNKVYTFINLAGLSVGISCCILIGLYVKYELSYDGFQQKGDRIARVIMEYNMGGNISKGNYTSTKVGPSFKKNFPEVESFVRMAHSEKIVKYNDRTFLEKRFIYADSTFFTLFSYAVLQGNPNKLLSGPNTVVLTQSAAKKYFGSESPVGKTLKISSLGVDHLITGVIEDCRDNSQLKFDFLASFSSLGASQEITYWNANYITYILLKDQGNIASLQKKILPFMKQEMKTELSGQDYLTYQLEPFKDVHLYSEHMGFEANGSITYIYIISAVALLILTIACFTFINLCTAKSVERAKEIGIRKVAGAVKKQIFWQFIGESALLTFLSVCISYLIVSASLPHFNTLINRNLSLAELASPSLIGMVLIIISSISLLAGAYPALILSAFQPVKVLKGIFKNTGSGLLLRKSLFVFQFIISVFLIVSSFIIQKQLNYFQNKKLGFDKEHVLVFPTDSKINASFSTFKSELTKNAAVLQVSKGDFEPCSIVGGYSMFKPGMPAGKAFSVNAGGIDDHYLKACSIKVIAGSDINEEDIKEATNEDYTKSYYHFVLNESAAKQLGWTAQEAIGKKMFLDMSRPGIVKAVVADFHFSSLHNPIKPLVLFPSNYGNIILVKVAGNNLTATMADIEKTWKEVIPHRPFEYSFLDDNYKAMYHSELQLGKAMNVFTVLAVLLAVLGLFGLSSYSIQQRAKEIGILKVLGAPMHTIVTRLSKNFIWLVFIAICISFPLAWWAMYVWLQDFSYRIDMSIWLFIIPGLASVLIALLTVGIKALSAASVNPIKNLRTE